MNILFFKNNFSNYSISKIPYFIIILSKFVIVSLISN